MPEIRAEYACPQCGEVMDQIKVVAQGHQGAHHELTYTAVEAEPSFWLGRFPVEGAVNARMCSGCHYILFYGLPGRRAELLAVERRRFSADLVQNIAKHFYCPESEIR